MDRVNRLKFNTAASFLQRFVLILSGLILPRLILLYYGSEINGLTASINQFLSVITFLDLGVGSVVQSALYRPLANKDTLKISKIIYAARKYFRNISYLLIVYIVGLMLFYPLLIEQSISFLATSFLIFAMSISFFSQFYFGIVNELFLNADQKGYIQLGTEIIVILLNLAATVFLITQGFSIQMVRLTTGLIYLIRPLYLSYYVNKHYDIQHDIEIKDNPLPQKWHGMAQHLAWSVHNSTDIVILTAFSTLENVSVYSIYNMVVQAVRAIITSLTDGLTSFFGDLLANEEIELLNGYFDRIEWLLHTFVTYLFGMTLVLINSFVMLYTTGVTDINYYVPTFSFILIITQYLYSLRSPYQLMILAAGHFKETQKASVIEAVLNIIFSLLLVNNYGLIGVAIGGFFSILYRSGYVVWYISKNIIKRPLKLFWKQFFVDILSFVLMIFLGGRISSYYQIERIMDWIFLAILLGIIFVFISLIINIIFYKEIVTGEINRLKEMVKR